MLCWWPCVKILAGNNARAFESVDTFLTFSNYVQSLCRFVDSYSRRKSYHVSLMLCWWPCVKILAGNSAHAFESADTVLTFCKYVQNLCRFDDSYNSGKQLEPVTHVMLMTVCENLPWKQLTRPESAWYIFDDMELCLKSMPVWW